MAEEPDGLLPEGFRREVVFEGDELWTGRLPTAVRESVSFDGLWELHPPEFHRITMHGRVVDTPRWQQAYGQDYHYSGQVNRAQPVPAALVPLLDWARTQIDARLNGLLLNWYDGALGHYIGPHRDSTQHVPPGSPIVTVSFGEERVFRLRPRKGRGRRDFVAEDGTVFIMPYETNARVTHEVPHFKRYSGRRVSVTLRAFESPPDERVESGG